MTLAQVQRQERYHDKVFRFAGETAESKEGCVLSFPAIPHDGKFRNDEAGCEWFAVYWWLRKDYRIS